ncbi:venom allergen 3-like [Phlebotomus papatasi]|uniref:venom allergen 3-like n=1 Tax=Phlebotomus papatasi TaxID=29031 RepID=UPI00248395D9|nr:venom allergen 3-like [Phlebotomus papatasi]
MKFVLFLLLVIAIIVTFAEAIDWCQMQAQYCSGREHIMCQPNSFPMGQNVRNIQMVTMTPAIIQAGIDRHNYHRSNVASGRVGGIPSASAMQQMSWHPDLALVAAEHARHGNFQHDQCRGFTEFPMSGQNLAIRWSSASFTNFAQEFVSFVDLWYDEMPIIRDSRLSCIDSFTTSNPNCLEAGHFTVMVNDINAFLGCALVTFEQQMGTTWWNSIMLTCNYAGNNIIGQRLYARGTPCSGCASVGRQCDASTSLCV